MFNIVIYSKDRPCQLDLLLRSIEKNFDGWLNQKLTVIYNSSFKDYTVGYDICSYEHRHFEFINDNVNGFKAATENSLSSDHAYTLWFVDDNIMLRPFSEKDEQFQRFARDPNILCLSMRMHPGVSRCYTENKETPAPPISPEGIWNWSENRQLGDWSYPMSLDANIYRTASIRSHVTNMPYTNPNTMEGAFAQYPLSLPYMICYPEPRVLNVPANRVQNVNGNRSGNVDTLELNRLYILGKRINLDMFQGMVQPSPHFEVPYRFGDAINGIGDLMHLQ